MPSNSPLTVFVRTSWDIYFQIAISCMVSVITTLAVLSYLR